MVFGWLSSWIAVIGVYIAWYLFSRLTFSYMWGRFDLRLLIAEDFMIGSYVPVVGEFVILLIFGTQFFFKCAEIFFSMHGKVEALGVKHREQSALRLSRKNSPPASVGQISEVTVGGQLSEVLVGNLSNQD